ncbi:Smr/MutS family protein [Rubrolithibacter danxiaensis]|uniref:Smr/MutS family protein n=1 Tax=Rubrolithibacter danxiaensis TaxID=3390805 RepID=UPI003BF8E39C
MKFKLGDFVRFVDERREGYVTKIFDEQTIGVTGEDDFEIPVLASKVTFIQGRKLSDTEENKTEEAIPAEEFQTKGIFLALITDQRIGSVVHFHVVNETSFQLLLSFTSEKPNQYKGEFAGIIAPQSSANVFSANLNELGNWPKFYIKALYFSRQNQKPPEPLLWEEKFKAKDFAGAKKQVALLNQQGWSFKLDKEDLVIDAEKLKESFYKPAEKKKEIEKPAREIDLHIEKLRDDYQFLSKTEILNTQLDKFKKSLDAAIVHKLPSLVFIHGIGNGTLRNEIHKLLGKHQQVKTFMDARKEKFGYGATEVILK